MDSNTMQEHPLGGTGVPSRWSMRRAAATAGIGLMLMIAPAVVGNFVAVEGLVTPGDAAQTAADIAA